MKILGQYCTWDNIPALPFSQTKKVKAV